MSDQQRASTKVSLEELLRVKRAERPPQEFWVEFERSLRAKQLAALVNKRPWWKSWSGVSRWSIPVGAAAALTVTWVSLSSRTAPLPGPVVAIQPAQVLRETLSNSAPALVVPEDEVSAAAVQVAASDDSMATRGAPEQPMPTTAREPVVTAVQPGSVMEQVAGLSSGSDTDAVPAARFAGTYAKASTGVGEFSFDRPAAVHVEDTFRTDKTSSIEPLSQIATPRDARRARLLAFSSSVDTRTPQYSNSTGVIRSRERIATHLNEEALSDSIRRLGVKGGGVSIQF